MPITRRAYNRKKLESSKNGNIEENVQTQQTIRQSKNKAVENIKKLFEESPGFTVKDKGDPDAFDMLCSSPLKQEVHFKPLSFWSKKVKDLESKEVPKKKKLELYDLSGTDNSSSTEGKKSKKKGKTTGRRQKNAEKKANKLPYNLDAKNFLKKKMQESKPNGNKEASIVRERIILHRLNENCIDKKDKFSFNKINAFGLTSTPGRREKLNIVGGSMFDFLSPITSCGNISKSKSLSQNDKLKGVQTKMYANEDNCYNETTVVTPKKIRKKGENENITKDLRRVSENELLRNIGSVDSFLEKNFSPENFLLNSHYSVINAESHFESCKANSKDLVLDLPQVVHEENEMNKTFLSITENEFQPEDDDNLDFKISEYVGGGYSDVDYYQNLNFEEPIKETDLLKSMVRLKVLFKIFCSKFDYYVDVTLSSRFSFDASRFSVQPVILHNFSHPTGKDQVNFSNLAELSLDLGLHNTISTTEESSTNSINDCTIRNSFRYVQVRRRCNFFLNFRGSAKQKDFNLSRNESIVNCVKQDYTLQEKAHIQDSGDKVPCFDNGSFKISLSTVSERSYKSRSSENNNTITIKGLLNKQSNLTELPNQFEIEDQQTHMDNTASNFKLFKKYDMRSNQYRSKKTETDLLRESTVLCFTSGNDSSILLSPQSDSEDKVDCSICKNHVENIRFSHSGDFSDVRQNLTKSEPIKRDSKLNNVTCFRGIGGLTQYKKRMRANDSEKGESKMDSGTAVPSPIIKSAPVENTISSELSFMDEGDFPLPIFESTTCKTALKENSTVSSSKKSEKDTVLNVGRISGVARNIDEGLSESKISDITSFQLKPGKKWAKSAMILKKALNGTLFLGETCSPKKRGRRFQTLVEEVLSMQTDIQDQNTATSLHSVTAVTNRMSNLTVTMRNFGNRTVKVLEEAEKDSSFQSIFRINATSEKLHWTTMKTGEECNQSVRRETQYFSARDLVLMRCNQEAPLPFDENFNEKTLKKCKKIGEGTFGEVFMYSQNRVIKIIPIEGPDEVNGEPQKKFDEIITEMVIAMELSNLRNAENYRTNGFSELKRCWCVVGEYPKYLIDLWNDFDSAGHGSENDSPEMFKSDQLYIILEFENGGYDLESFVFSSAEQSYSIFVQVAFSLAVAERILEFEHRDLHWGNILIAPTRKKFLEVMISGEEYKIPTKGVKATIIDFTLSRISYDGCSIFNDLSLDPTLFTSEGDYQFEIYRKMREEVMNDWSVFRPRTNLFWLHYVLDKMLLLVRYKKTIGKIHKMNVLKFLELKASVLDYRDSEDFILNVDLF